MEIKIKDTSGKTFREMKPGDVFVHRNDVMMKSVTAKGEPFAVKLKDGQTEWLATETTVAPVSATLKVEW